MKNSVLISIQPKWCELIASGKKTVEVRKTRPKIETPFKCYVYCTKNRDMLWVLKKSERIYTDKIASIINAKDVGGATKVNGTVIGEFICDCIGEYWFDKTDTDIEEYEDVQLSCLSANDILAYGKGKELYYWNISDLVIYDKPKELSEFIGIRYLKNGFEVRELERPPQSWCYVVEAT